ncbi:MAG: ATPase [Kiritimatiellia bacterium]
MAEDLQNLLDRIQKDGVEKAQSESDKIISEAKDKAHRIVDEAETNAQAKTQKADNEAKAFAERSRKSLRQTARDVILSVEEVLNSVIRDIVSSSVEEALDADTLKQMLTDVVKAYCGDKSGGKNIEVLLNPDQRGKIQEFFTAELGKQLKSGMEIKPDDGIISGFRVSMPEDKVEHDFTGEAVAEAMCALLRPRLAAIVKKALQKHDVSEQ